ncbi:MAG TPA: hypothetical protein VG938_06815 [Verrucomicrobiae bacterium]|jgi:hypothetical protein|nr:hypothetical protein [Verrucomicrobiae bacterium]
MRILSNPNRKHAARGYALASVLILSAVAIVVLAGTMRRSDVTASLNQRNNQFVACANAAEAATEKVIARMRGDYLNGGDVSVDNGLASYAATVPTSSEDSYWDNFTFSDAQGGTGKTYVGVLSNRTYAPLDSQYYGLSGWRTVYRIVSNAQEKNGAPGVVGAVQQDVEMDSIPVFQFAIFYNGLLEFTWAAPFTVRGRTHANGNIFTGSTANLKFLDLVTATGIVQKMAWDGYTVKQMNGSITYTGHPGYSTNVPTLSLPIGATNTADAVREIINPPPAGESVDSSIGEARYYNKAGMLLLVSNSTVTAVIKSSADDSVPVTITCTNLATVNQTFPFLSLTNTFTDQRESKTILATQIYMDSLGTWLGTNVYTDPDSPTTKHPASNPMNVLYVSDNRTTTTTQLSAVRLMNGTNLPSSPGVGGTPTGFTVATPNPLYVQGNYNCPPGYENSTNTSHSVPASLISDALTILSSNWQDSKSSGSLGSRGAANTTVNAAIITGIVYSGGSDGSSPFSGGVMNLPRLLEDWGNGSVKLTLNTSIVNLFNSVRATAPFQNPGLYYYAPTRDFNFDLNFKDATKLPPGTPTLGVILRAGWGTPPPNNTTYAGR